MGQAIVGARIFTPADQLGMIIDYTPSTLPPEIRERLDHYAKEGITFRLRTDGHPTLRAVNRYKGQLRIFEYLTTPQFFTPTSMINTELFHPLPSVLHFVPMKDRLERILEEVDQLKSTRGGEGWDPVLIWEPDIPICTTENYEFIRSMTPRTHIISPNHSEALSLLGLPTLSTDPNESKSELTSACLLLAQMRPKLAVILRCGSMGCCFIDTTGPLLPDDVIWIPPFWEPNMENRSKVVDPTGAGNSFMGGVGAALHQGLTLREAVIWGTVSASFVIEQDGLPNLDTVSGRELWNGEDPMDRVRLIKERLEFGTRAEELTRS